MTAETSKLTPTQQQIVELLPATTRELAEAIYGRATKSEINAVYVHIHYLQGRLSGGQRILTEKNTYYLINEQA